MNKKQHAIGILIGFIVLVGWVYLVWKYPTPWIQISITLMLGGNWLEKIEKT